MLDFFAAQGCTQYLLSASETGVLKDMTEHFGIAGYFKEIKGLDNHYAAGKSDLGKELLGTIGAAPDTIVMIGDTCHDKEVADVLGVEVILCTYGHFPEDRLMSCGSVLINDLSELKSIVSGS